MAGLNILTLGSGKTYTNMVALGISNMRVSGTTVYFTVAATGEEVSVTLPTPTDGKDGVSITSIDIDANNYLICTMSDGTEQKAKINFLDNVYTKTETDNLLKDKAEKIHNHDDVYAAKDKEHEHTNKETLDKFGVNDGGKLTFNGDVVTPEASDLSDYLKKTEAQNTYVTQETGKGLSTNDYTTEEKEKLAGLENYNDTQINADISALSTRVKTVEDDYVKSADLPSLSGYATETWVNEQGFLTEHQDISGKVDKVEGKSLISDTEIARLATVDNYDDTDIRTELANKADAIAIPSKVSVLENDSKYQTESDVTTTLTDYATKTYVGEQITNAEHLKREIVTVLPSDTEASDNIIYMLKVESATGNDKYQEYMKIDGTVQMVGDTSVDLTDYAKSVDIPTTVAELTDSADYAKKTDLHSHTNKTVLDGITSTKVSNWDSAKTHADSAHAPSNAQANVIETVKVNGTALIPSSKAVNVTVPTKVSELTNDSGYIIIDDTKSSDTTTYSSSKIDSILNLRREIRIGEIYDSNGYYKILVKGYYARPIYFRVVASNGGEEILSFGQSVVNSRKVIGKSVNTKFRYIAPAANGEKGTLLLRSNASEIALTIFCTYMYGIESTPIIEASTAEEFNSGTEFTTIDKIGSTDISSIGDGTVTGAIDTINTSLANYSIPLNLYMAANHYLAIKVNVHDINYSFNMSDRSGNIYEGSFFSYNGSFSVQITKINNSLTKIGYILGFRQYKVSSTEFYLVMKVSDYTYINGVINTSSALKSNIEILVNDDSTLWDKGTDIVVKEVGYINDSSTGDTNSTWSSSKINSSLNDKAKKYESIEYSTSAIYVNDEFIRDMMDYVFSVLKEKEPSTLGGGTIKVVELNKYFMFQGYCSPSNLTGTVYEVINSGRTWSYYFTTTGQKVVKELATMDKLGGLTFSASGTTLSITDGKNTWTLEANS